jgi:hypothetical protein
LNDRPNRDEVDMKRTYIWNKDLGKMVEITKEAPQRVGPFVISDLPEYRSPLTGKMIDGRRDRREEMKREGVREVDPSEKYDIGRATVDAKPSEKVLENG